MIPGDNYLPVIDSDEMTSRGFSTFPSLIQSDDFTSDSFSTREDTVNDLYYIVIEDLQPSGETNVDQYTITFFLTGPPFAETIDLSTWACRTLDENGNILSEDSDADTSGQSVVVISVPTATEYMTIAVDSSVAGQDSTTLTLEYTTIMPMLASSWFIITVPKSNLVYETDNPDDPVALIDTDNYLTATVVIDGATTL